MGEAKSLLKKLLIVPVVTGIHFVSFFVVAFFCLYFGTSTFSWGYTVSNVFYIVLNILLFPWNILVTWFPSIDLVGLPMLLNSLLWGFGAYGVIIVWREIRGRSCNEKGDGSVF
jgi:hypothetical protein